MASADWYASNMDQSQIKMYNNTPMRIINKIQETIANIMK